MLANTLALGLLWLSNVLNVVVNGDEELFLPLSMRLLPFVDVSTLPREPLNCTELGACKVGEHWRSLVGVAKCDKVW